MLMLRRIIRFAVNEPSPARHPSTTTENHELSNGFGGTPSMRGFGRHYELSVVTLGTPDPRTGYLINIKDIDRAARAVAIPLVERACAQSPHVEPSTIMPQLFAALDGALSGSLHEARLHLSPTYSVGMERNAQGMAILRQQFDLAAAHRLHVESMSDDENRRIFGKCNNPHGHGHNYRVEPAVAVPVGQASSGGAFTLADLERLTLEHLVARFDHTHLNLDTQEFASGPAGLNPSVENIAKVFFERLAPAVHGASHGTAALRAITVWETDRTSCTYPA